ncbi:MAG TPA: hypothetical protein VMM60_14680 [Ilumatobacter sp.]|nr:hypothetical protein [Ilumatobacter sp.]
MALREKIASSTQPLLKPGESIQNVAAAQATSPYWSLLSYWIVLLKDSYRVIVETDQRIVLCKTSRWRWTKVTAVVTELPKGTNLGEPTGLNWKTESFGQTLWINKRFHKDVKAINSSAS